MAYGITNEVAKGFDESTKRYFLPEELGGYKLLGDDPWSLDLKTRIMRGVRYELVMQWVEGKNPEPSSTSYYQHLQDILYSGNLNGILLENEDNILRQISNFRTLYDSIVKEGFRDIPVYRIHNDFIGKNYYYGGINLTVLNDGRLDFGDGRHRIAILLALNLPVRFLITSRQSLWRQWRLGIIDGSFDSGINHPDFKEAL